MAHYRKVDIRIWNDAKFLDLSDDAKLLFFLLMTHPNQTALGAMRCSLASLADDLGWDSDNPSERVSDTLPDTLSRRLPKAFSELSQKGMVKHSTKPGVIWLPNFLKYNPPENPNVVTGWQKSADLIPECAIKTQVIATAGLYLKGFGKGFTEAFAKAFGEPFAKGMPKQEQEQEQEQEQKSLSAASAAGTAFEESPQSADKAKTPEKTQELAAAGAPMQLIPKPLPNASESAAQSAANPSGRVVDDQKRWGEKDPHFDKFKAELEAYWKGVNRETNIPFAWQAVRDAAALNSLLKTDTKLTLAQFKTCLMNRAHSERVPGADPFYRWLRDIRMYADGPLDEYKRVAKQKRRL